MKSDWRRAQRERKRMKAIHELKRKKKMAKLGVYKVLVWLVLFGGAGAYHLVWVDSLLGFSFESDFALPHDMSPLGQDGSGESGGFNQSMGEFDELGSNLFEGVFGASGVNVSQAFDNINHNETLIAPLLASIPATNLTTDEFHAALQNATIPDSVKIPIFEALWRFEIPKLFPAWFYQPFHLHVRYSGSITIREIAAFVDLHFGKLFRLVEVNQSVLRRGGLVEVTLTPGEVLQGVIDMAFDALVNATFEAISSGGFGFYETIGEYLGEEFLSLDPGISLGMSAWLGVYPVQVDAYVNITNLIAEYRAGGGLE
ncbi:MAG: hypothetical protein ACTSU5_04535 [Promethearchaeota archaeon]